MARPAKTKLTVLVDEAVATVLRRAVDTGAARSQGELIGHAIRDYVRRLDRDAVRSAYAEAARDSSFLKDIDDVARDFREVDEETPE